MRPPTLSSGRRLSPAWASPPYPWLLYGPCSGRSSKRLSACHIYSALEKADLANYRAQTQTGTLVGTPKPTKQKQKTSKWSVSNRNPGLGQRTQIALRWCSVVCQKNTWLLRPWREWKTRKNHVLLPRWRVGARRTGRTRGRSCRRYQWYTRQVK